jgi:photosystem II stability/assembly factor-like uncharacterized protein
MKRIISLFFYIFFISASVLHSQWYIQNSGTNMNLNKVKFINSLTGWVCGTNSYTSELFIKTTNSGSNWFTISTGVNNFKTVDFDFINENIGFCIGHSTGSSNESKILKTTNGGGNWEEMFDTVWAIGTYYVIKFADLNTGWIFGMYGSILKTTNGGINWNVQAPSVSYNFMSACFINNNTGWATSGDWFAYHYYGSVIKTTNGGINWNCILGGASMDILPYSSIFFVNANIGWVIHDNPEFLKSTDGGINWFLQTTNIPNGSIRKVFFTSINIGWGLCYLNGSYKIEKTTDSGYNWYMQDIGTTNYSLMDIFLVDTNYGWAVGYNGIILRTTNGGGNVNAINETNDVIKFFSLFQNYPNPFNPITNIKFDIPKDVFVTIKIYDLLGREIKTLVNEFKNAGSFIVSFNGSEFASGVYFYRIQAGNFVSVKRMVLIK